MAGPTTCTDALAHGTLVAAPRHAVSPPPLSSVNPPATLTSYSENAERGGKHGDGSRGSLKLWQSHKSPGGDSFLYRVDENMAASTYSLNKIPERSLDSAHSSHSAHSIPLSPLPLPHPAPRQTYSQHLLFSPPPPPPPLLLPLMTAHQLPLI